MKIVWRTAMTIDGRVAGAGHDLAFLDSIDTGPAGEDFSAFLKSIDAIILGANTLRWLLREGHGWPHRDIATWLVSHDTALAQQVGATEAPFHRVDGNLAPMLAAIEAAGHLRVWLCGGGDIAGRLLEMDRMDEVDVTIAPTAVGGGYSLFGDRPIPARVFDVVGAPRLLGNAVVMKWARHRH
jgi:riboflavin biosynthesis pyrimidine reductase